MHTTGDKKLIRTHRFAIWLLILFYSVVIYIGGWHWRTDFLFLMILIYATVNYSVLCLHAWLLDSPSPWKEGLRRYHAGMTFYESRAEVAAYHRELQAVVEAKEARDKLAENLRAAAQRYPSVAARIGEHIDADRLEEAAELLKWHQERLREEKEKERRLVEIRRSRILAEAERLKIPQAEMSKIIETRGLDEAEAHVRELKKTASLLAEAKTLGIEGEAVRILAADKTTGKARVNKLIEDTRRQQALVARATGRGLMHAVAEFETDRDEAKLDRAIREAETRSVLAGRMDGLAMRIANIREPKKLELIELLVSATEQTTNRDLAKALHALEQKIEEAEETKRAKRRGG